MIQETKNKPRQATRSQWYGSQGCPSGLTIDSCRGIIHTTHTQRRPTYCIINHAYVVLHLHVYFIAKKALYIYTCIPFSFLGLRSMGSLCSHFVHLLRTHTKKRDSQSASVLGRYAHRCLHIQHINLPQHPIRRIMSYVMNIYTSDDAV